MSDPAPILVFGASGQLARGLALLLGPRAVLVDQEDADFSSPGSIAPLLERHSPSVVINAAAYTAVDRAESDEDRALLVNGISPGVVAEWCARRDIPLLHFSTDYVFNGVGDRPWTEADEPDPVNAYGRTKLDGERRVAAAGGRWLVFRTSWLYDAFGANFLTTMLRLGRERESISVVADQFGAPTYAPHLASAALRALGAALSRESFPSGIYHLCNAGETSWHGFAEEIFATARARGLDLRVRHLNAVPAAEYPTAARRPANSRLDTSLAARAFGVRLPEWRQGLLDCMEHYEVH